MKRLHRLLLCFALVCLWTAPAFAVPKIGEAALDFTLPDPNGVAHTLSGYEGSLIVLEWTNPQCPYVRKHYGTGTMQALQKDAMTKDKAVWLRIDSSGKGMEGYLDPVAARALIASDQSSQTAFLLDPKGDVGRLYGATTTPDMVVIDKSGMVQYMGAIDDAPSADPATLVNAKSYVRAALADLRTGDKVLTPLTQPYGCAVKYSNRPGPQAAPVP